MAYLIGRQFGDYTLRQLVGRGPFSEVYLAQHSYLSSIVAIKISLEQQQANSTLLYKRASIQGHLNHPHILPILQYNNQKIPFLVMDFAARGSLQSHLLQQQHLEPALLLSYIRQIAKGLSYAHSKQVIHGNLKPENILLNQQDMLFLSDFDVSETSFPSQTEEVLNTLRYRAPEQNAGKISAASDQYILACLAYEWLSGQNPFADVQSDIQPLSRATREVLQRAMAPDIRQRYPDINDFAIALEQSVGIQQLISPPLPLSSQPARRPSLNLRIGIFVLLFLLIISGLFTGLRFNAFRQSSASSITPSSIDPTELYAALMKKQPSFDDTPNSPNLIHWTTYTDRAGDGCKLSKDGLHLTLSKPDMAQCFIRESNMVRDFAFQIQMTILQGGGLEAGLLFRANPNGVAAYRFVLDTIEYVSYFQVINPNGTYASKTSDGSSAIKSGLQHTNIFTCIARDHTFYLYINGTFIGNSPKIENTYQAGSLGVIAFTDESIPMDIVFTHTKIWI